MISTNAVRLAIIFSAAFLCSICAVEPSEFLRDEPFGFPSLTLYDPPWVDLTDAASKSVPHIRTLLSSSNLSSLVLWIQSTHHLRAPNFSDNF